MISFRKVLKGRAHIVDDKIIYSRGNKIYECTEDFDDHQLIGVASQGFITDLLASNRWTARLLRLGVHGLYQFKNTYLGIQKGRIVLYDRVKKTFNSVFENFNGSRPLSILITPRNEIYFGEYFANKERIEVRIFRSLNGFDWEVAFEFAPKEIRHVHGLTWDPFLKGMWVQTGDSNAESGLWFTQDRFKSITKYSDYSQRSRAVEIIPFKEGQLIVPMDSPLEKNYILSYNYKEERFENIFPLPGSAFHCAFIEGVYLVATVTEPSKINKTNKSAVFASLNGYNWSQILSFPRDFIPIKFQKYFGYTEPSFPRYKADTGYLYFNLKGIKGLDNSIIQLKTEEIKEFLRNSNEVILND